MNLESTGGSTTTESTERDDFTKAEARLDEINSMNLGDMSDDDLESVMVERKALRAQKTEMVGDAQDEANAENQKIDDLEQQKAEAERAAAEALAEAQQAEEKARALEERKNEDAEKIAALRAEITGEGKPAQEEAQEVVVEKQQEVPKNEMLEKYSGKMRAFAQELLRVTKEMSAKQEIMGNDSLPMEERLKAQSENEALKNSRRELKESSLRKPDFRRKKFDETYNEYSDYQYKEMDKYEQAEKGDPETVLLLAEAGDLGKDSSPNTGIGKVDSKLRRDPDFMRKMLGVMSKNSAEAFWAHTEGDARKDKSLYIAAIQKNHLNYQWGSDEMKKDPEVQKVALASGLYPMYLKK